MAIKIYNTLTRQKEEFKPINEGEVNFYVCGPTVYDYIHIGNARSAVAFDIIRRYLIYRGYKVKYVMNFTDIDDKIIKASKEEGISEEELADKYIAAFIEDTSSINVLPADVRPRVSEHIPDIISFIEDLIEKGYAYEVDGDVYYRTSRFDKYGNLSDQSIEELMAGASQRVDGDITERKENPLDFALWKKTETGLNWKSPWSNGRPGWHIECSVMSTKHLGETLDIHGGGQDLQFPHHENEIAQSEARTGKVFSNYWMHNGFVTLGKDDEKMSKSIGNVVVLRDMLKEEDPMVIRYLLSSVHYRRPLTYDKKALWNAKQEVQRFKTIFQNISYRMKDLNADNSTISEEWSNKLSEIEEEFQEVMDDDFNVANGLTVVYELTKLINIYLEEKEVSFAVLNEMKDLLTRLLEVFGLEFSSKESLLDDEIQALIDKRLKAREDKDYALSDKIRDDLKEQGIILEDTPQGTRWKRVGE